MRRWSVSRHERGLAEIVVVDNASTDTSLDRHRDVRANRALAGQHRLRPAANLGMAATRAAIVAVMNPDMEFDSGRGRGAMFGRLAPTRGSGVVAPDRATSTVPTIRRRAKFPRVTSLPATCSRRCGPRIHEVAGTAKSRCGPTSRVTSTGCPAPRCGCGGRALDDGRRMGRALLHVPRGHRPLRAAARHGMACALRASWRRRTRRRCEPSQPPLPFDRRPSPQRVSLRGNPLEEVCAVSCYPWWRSG